MRTLKKTLSLVLVVVMLLGVCAFSVSAVDNFEPYKDAESVGEDYEEAVDLLVALGVVRGTSETTLDPEATYTREEGAAIVARISLGITAAEALSKNSSPFTDVEAGRWSAGYIAYCAENGILDGVGDGSFKPTGTLTGYAFAKMLLTAVGYGKNAEYVGAAWELNVARDGIRKGIFNGDLDAATSEPIQRQQAILMAFNALTDVPVVKFSTLINDYVAIGASQYDIVTGGSVDDEKLVMQFGALKTTKAITYEGAYVIDSIWGSVEIDSNYTELGRTAHVWYVRTPKGPLALTKHYMSDTLLGTSYDGTPYSDLTNPASGAYIASADPDGVTFYLNGEKQDTATAPPFRIGADVAFYDTDRDGKVNVVTVLEKTVATLTGNPVYTNKGDTVALPGVYVGTRKAATIEGLEGLAKDDVVLYVESQDGILHIQKAESVNTKLVRFSQADVAYGYDNDNLTFRDSTTEYYLSGLRGVKDDLGTKIVNGFMGVTAKYFFDEHGFIVTWQKIAESLSDYVMLINIGKDSSHYDTGAATVFGNLVRTDGKTAEVTVAGFMIGDDSYTGMYYNIGDGKYYAVRNNSEVDPAIKNELTVLNPNDYLNQFYTYVSTANGYMLTPVANQETKTNAPAEFVTTNRAKMDFSKPYYGNSNTVYLMYNETTRSFRSYVGVKNAPKSAANATIIVAAPANADGSKGGNATVVYIGAGVGATTANRYFFPDATEAAINYDDMATEVNEMAYIYPAVNEDGELIEIKLTSQITKPGFYNVEFAGAGASVPEGYGIGVEEMTLVKDHVTDTPTVSTVAAEDGVVVSGNKAYTFDENKVVVYTLSKNSMGIWSMTTGGIVDIITDINDRLYAVVAENNETYASIFYVVKAADPKAYIDVVGAAGSATLTVKDSATKTEIPTSAGMLTYTFQWEGPDTITAPDKSTTTVDAADIFTVTVTATRTDSGASYMYSAKVTIGFNEETGMFYKK